LDIAALLGYTGVLFKKFFSTGIGMVTSFLIMALWTLVPLFTGLIKFNKKDF